MAIVLDSTSSTNASASSVTLSHTCSGADRTLLVAIAFNGNFSAPVVATHTYSGVAMTEVFSSNPGGAGRALRIYRLDAPATGANNIQLTWTATYQYAIAAVSYTGVSAVASTVAAVKAANTGDASTNSITVNSGDLLVSFVGSDLNEASIIEGAGQVRVAGDFYTSDPSIHISSEAASGGADTAGWTGFSGNRWSATLLQLAPSVTAGPSITSTTDPAITGSNVTIAGTGFGASQGSGGVTQEQGAVVVGLAESAWSDISITSASATIESTGLKYGSQTLRVTDDAAAEDTITFEADPLANNDYVDLTSVATVGQIVTEAGSLAIGDQLRYQDVLYQGGSPTAYFVTVNADATYTFDGATPDGSYTFEVRAWDTGDQTWGVSGRSNGSSGFSCSSRDAFHRHQQC